MQSMPFPLLRFWIAGLRTAGVRFPQSLLDSARLVSFYSSYISVDCDSG